MDAAAQAQHIRASLPESGLFAAHDWRIAPAPFPLRPEMAEELEALGRMLLQFYRASDLLYRQSIAGRQPEWICQWLDQGKPDSIINLQRQPQFKTALPSVIRPDILLTEEGWRITELDNVPGGIGLTGWLNQTYSPMAEVIGGQAGMIDGFSGIFKENKNIHLVVSEESATYRPEMEWLAGQIGTHCAARPAEFDGFAEGDGVYRFFELFDLPNVQCAERVLNLAGTGAIYLTAPPKAYLEEKMWFALFWNRHLRDYWQRELGGRFFAELQRRIPQTWLIDPKPLPPHGAIPGLNLTDWRQLSNLSQRERSLILKLSGFNERAWGARSVRLGSDKSQIEWAAAVDEAILGFDQSPWILQRYEKPRRVRHEWFDFETNESLPLDGRARLCPYYFVQGEREVKLGGVLATICPTDKKIIHGMKDAILAPCSASEN